MTLIKRNKTFNIHLIFVSGFQNLTAPANFTEYSALSAAETSKGGAQFILGRYHSFLRQMFSKIHFHAVV